MKKDNRDGRDPGGPFSDKIKKILGEKTRPVSDRVTEALMFIDSIPDPSIEADMRKRFKAQLDAMCWMTIHQDQEQNRM